MVDAETASRITRSIIYDYHYFIEKYDQLIDMIADIPGWDLEVIGYTAGGMPLYAMKHIVGNDKPRILIVGGQHGNEPAGIAASIVLPYSLVADMPPSLFFDTDSLVNSLNIAIIPLANPDGFARYLECISVNPGPSWLNTCPSARLNSRYADINRDWMYLEQEETKAIHSFINKYNPDLVLDLHEFLARGSSPPKWAIETEGFMVTLTDNPYMMVHKDIIDLAHNVMIYTEKAIENIIGWKVKTRHFSGKTDLVPPPNILGAHLPLENKAKLLVETWGVGLHYYLWNERVTTHLVAIYSSTHYIASHSGEINRIREAINSDHPYGIGVKGYKIEGPDKELRKVRKLLELHNIFLNTNNTVYLRPGNWRITVILLDEDIEFNQKLKERFLGPLTIQRKYRVIVNRIV